MIKTLRVYVDTSVFGGCFDKEFAEASRRLFTEIKAGKFILVISSLTTQELDRAPEPVQRVLAEIPADLLEVIPEGPAIDQLRDAYLKANVVGPSSFADASVAEADMVVSWNFRHIVHYEKINGYHAVNLLNGYKPIPIYSPREVASL